ncbi:conjugal transfer protein TraH [Burkholderia glumae]|uniref:conjugal transfer protein TraH n=1 Tax=Burkholderia glumae TaxID=337 RepID=UPI0020369C56|nr:conjugal transfer protein TraH [Burkholderia glumae]MCM2552593.1 conjugal transfer protein TraH [Burkholderia glumae]
MTLRYDLILTGLLTAVGTLMIHAPIDYLQQSQAAAPIVVVDVQKLLTDEQATQIKQFGNGDPSDSNGTEVNPIFLPRIGSVTVEELVGNDPASATTDTIQLYQCDETTKCLNPSTQEVQFTTFRSLVQAKLQRIVDAVATRTPLADPSDTFQFLSMTDLPVYKMIAVGTRLNNSSVADQMLATYQSLMAAKYAEAYIRGSAEDRRRKPRTFGDLLSSSMVQRWGTPLRHKPIGGGVHP